MLQLASIAASFVFASWLAAFYISANKDQPASLAAAVSSIAKTTLPQAGDASGHRALASAVSAAAATDSLADGGGGADTGDCVGQICFTPTFKIIVALNVLTLCGVIWLIRSTRSQYQAIVAGRQQQQQQQLHNEEQEQQQPV